MKKLRMSALVALVGLMSAFVLPMSPANAQETLPTVDVSGTCTILQGPGTADDLAGTFEGTFTITRFVVRQGQLAARGTLQGVCTAISDSNITETVNRVVTIPVADIGQGATCEVLDLTLGPLHLDLLGLVVDLSPVHLQITAEQGPGNLLGNLLCAVAGLLDNTPSLAGIAQLLNQILAILG